MRNSSGEYINGYMECVGEGVHQGELSIEGVDLSPIEGQYFTKDGDTYLWIRRRDLLEYDPKTMKYVSRKRKPTFEAYLKKQMEDNVFAYVGVFSFLRFKFKIVGIWDAIDGRIKNRLNFFVDRLPLEQQTIINGINEMRKK